MKKRITIRLDEDIIEWFRSKGKGYQTLMNNALRNYVNADFDKTMMGREIRILSKTKDGWPGLKMNPVDTSDKVRQATLPKLKEQMAAMQDNQSWRKQIKAMPKKGKK